MQTIDIAECSPFVTPPAARGQMIETSYATCEDGLLRRTHDRADGSTVYHLGDAIEGDDPANEEPADRDWRPVRVRE